MLSALICLVFAKSQSASDFGDQWSAIRSAISRSYYARQSRSKEMTRLFDQFGPKISNSRNASDFEANVNAMIAAFGDSHFSYLSKSDQGWYLMDSLAKGQNSEEMPEIGAWFKPAQGGYEIQMLLEDGAAMVAGLRKGDIVEKIGSQPFTPIDALQPYVGKSATLTVLRNRIELTKSVPVSAKTAFDMFLDATRSSERIIDDNGKKIGYIHLWTMASDSFKSALSNSVYGKLKNTDGFILDLRDGFGGRPEGYADPFFRPDVELTWVTAGQKSKELFGYGRPLVTLINGGSRSAKEILSYLLKASHRSTLVGSTTAGNVLGTSPLKLASGAYIEIPIADVFADGQHIEGKGILPDVQVPREFDSEGKDLDLGAALDRLKDIQPRRSYNQA